MNFKASLEFLNSFQNFEQVLPSAASARRVWNLDRMKLLLERAGHPEKNYRCVLIAGTKGKGSTGFFLEAMLELSGMKTGFYSSPHLTTPRERIRTGGVMITEKKWAEAMDEIRPLLGPGRFPAALGRPTYFEVMTLLAAVAFKRAGVRMGIFEVGLGGRLDATNAIGHELSILTPVHFDHEALLGNTIAKIAAEKAAIIRPGSDVVMAPQLPEAQYEILKQVRHQKAVLHQAVPAAWKLPLAGDFQQQNAGTAYTAVRILSRKAGFKTADFPRLLASYKGSWPGRLEALAGGRVLIDGAHNPVSIEALVRNLAGLNIRKPVLVFGTSRDKNYKEMLRLLSQAADEIILTPLPSSRGQRLDVLLGEASRYFPLVFPAANVREAMRLADARAGKKRKIVAAGSFYLIGDVRNLYA